MNEPSERRLVRLGGADLQFEDLCGNVQGRSVVTFEGEYVGMIDNLLVDELQRTIRFLEVNCRGSEMDGPQTLLIPVKAVARIDENLVYLSCSYAVIVTAPSHNPHVEPIHLYLLDVEEHFNGE